MATTTLLGALVAALAVYFYADQKYDLVAVKLPEPATFAHLVALEDIPKTASKRAEFAANSILRDRSVRLFEGELHRPETVAISPTGQLVAVDSSNFLRYGTHDRNGAKLSTDRLHLGPGQGLALEFDAEGNLVVCIAGAGLYMVEKETEKVVLLTSRVSPDSPLQPNTAINYAEDLDFASDGTIYFTDGSALPPRAPHYEMLPPVDLTVLEGAMSGRLLAYTPTTKKTTVLATGFYFANGCALAKDESFVLVADLIAARVVKYHLKGPKAGSQEIIIDGLPGHPDNIRAAKDGTFWVALSGRLREAMFPLLPYKHVRALAAWLPAWMLPKDKPYGGIVQITGEGQVLRYLEDPKGTILTSTTAVTEGEEGLYIGSFTQNYVGFIAYKDLPPPFQAT